MLRERAGLVTMLCFNLYGWACVRAANAVTNTVRVPAGMFSFVADLGMVLFVSPQKSTPKLTNLPQKWKKNR